MIIYKAKCSPLKKNNIRKEMSIVEITMSRRMREQGVASIGDKLTKTHLRWFEMVRPCSTLANISTGAEHSSTWVDGPSRKRVS